jgi:hypothetical protein
MHYLLISQPLLTSEPPPGVSASLEQKSELLVEVKEAEEPPSLAFAFVSVSFRVLHQTFIIN